MNIGSLDVGVLLQSFSEYFSNKLEGLAKDSELVTMWIDWIDGKESVVQQDVLDFVSLHPDYSNHVVRVGDESVTLADLLLLFGQIYANNDQDNLNKIVYLYDGDVAVTVNDVLTSLKTQYDDSQFAAVLARILDRGVADPDDTRGFSDYLQSFSDSDDRFTYVNLVDSIRSLDFHNLTDVYSLFTGWTGIAAVHSQTRQSIAYLAKDASQSITGRYAIEALMADVGDKVVSGWNSFWSQSPWQIIGEVIWDTTSVFNPISLIANEIRLATVAVPAIGEFYNANIRPYTTMPLFKPESAGSDTNRFWVKRNKDDAFAQSLGSGVACRTFTIPADILYYTYQSYFNHGSMTQAGMNQFFQNGIVKSFAPGSVVHMNKPTDAVAGDVEITVSWTPFDISQVQMALAANRNDPVSMFDLEATRWSGTQMETVTDVVDSLNRIQSLCQQCTRYPLRIVDDITSNEVIAGIILARAISTLYGYASTYQKMPTALLLSEGPRELLRFVDTFIYEWQTMIKANSYYWSFTPTPLKELTFNLAKWGISWSNAINPTSGYAPTKVLKSIDILSACVEWSSSTTGSQSSDYVSYDPYQLSIDYTQSWYNVGPDVKQFLSMLYPVFATLYAKENYVYYPYSRVSAIDAYFTLVTDEELIEGLSKILLTGLAIIGVVTIAIIAKKAINASKRAYLKAFADFNALSSSYVTDQNPATLELMLKAYRKMRILSLLPGASTISSFIRGSGNEYTAVSSLSSMVQNLSETHQNGVDISGARSDILSAITSVSHLIYMPSSNR